jgi:hypothetical protein
MAKGRLNPNTHNAFSSFRQISASGLSGNKLILTIFFPSYSKIFARANTIPPLPGDNYKGQDCQIRTNWAMKY